MKLGSAFRGVFEIVAGFAALWALLVSPLMLIGTHGVSSDHDKSLGRICLFGGVLILFGILWIEKNILGRRSNRGVRSMF
jgi:hypothetical protein